MPYVPGPVARRPVETSRKQVRKALLVLEELDDHLQVLGSSRLPRQDQVRVLMVCRRRAWLAMAALGSPREAGRSWEGPLGVARRRASLRKVLFERAALVARAVAFLLRSLWRFMRAVVRLGYTLRAIWP